jgi:hypothetical protein
VGNGDTWYEVGQGKTYTPTADDVGHVLKLECMAVDSVTGIGISAASTVLTSQVIPAPSPTPRRLILVNSIDGPAALEMEGRTAAPGTFTVLSYNVLADLYATSDMYSYCPPWALSWAYRRQNLLREIVNYRADILCLQEVPFYLIVFHQCAWISWHLSASNVSCMQFFMCIGISSYYAAKPTLKWLVFELPRNCWTMI